MTFLSPSQASGSPQYDGGRGGFLLPCVLFENLSVCLSGPSIQVLGWEGNPSSQFLFNYTTCGSQLHLSTMCVSGMEVRPWGLSTKHPCPQPSWRPCYLFSRLKLHTYTQTPSPPTLVLIFSLFGQSMFLHCSISPWGTGLAGMHARHGAFTSVLEI